MRLQNLYWDGTKESISDLGYWGYVVWMNYPTVYLIASLLIIIYAIKAKQLLDEKVNNGQIKSGNEYWLKRIILAFQYYFAFILIVVVIDSTMFGDIYTNAFYYFRKLYYYPFFLGLAILTYWLGLEGFNRKNILLLKTKVRTTKGKSDLERIAVRLKELMETEKLYKEPNLNLRTLAEAIPTKPYLLSQCFSEVINEKFSDYINTHRIEEVKQLIQSEKHQQQTLLSLAFEAGFNSKSSFNRAVKKQLGVSPKKLREIAS